MMQRPRAALHDTVVVQHRPDGAKEALHVQPKAQVLHIVAVQPGLIGDLQLIAAMDLGPARQAGADIVGTVFVPLGQQVVLIPEGRPGADDRHVAHKDIPQLGQLVQAGLAQEPPHPGDILVRVVEEMGGHIVGGVDPHGAEFQDVEMLFVDAHPFLLEKHRAGRIQLDGDAEHQQQGRKADHAAQ